MPLLVLLANIFIYSTSYMYPFKVYITFTFCLSGLIIGRESWRVMEKELNIFNPEPIL